MKLNRILMLSLALLVAAGAAYAEAAAPDSAKSLSVKTFTFKYKDAEKAAALIKPLLSADGSMSIQPSTNALVVTDRAENMKSVVRMIGDFDLPAQSFRLSVRVVSASRVTGDSPRVPDELKDVAPKLAMLRYNALESAGQAEFEGKEGDPGIVEMASGYRADFKLGEYDPSSDSIKVSDFHLSRLQKSELASLTNKMSLNLRMGQTYIVGATRNPKDPRALMIVLVAHR